MTTHVPGLNRRRTANTMANRKKTNGTINDLQNNTHKTKDRVTLDTPPQSPILKQLRKYEMFGYHI